VTDSRDSVMGGKRRGANIWMDEINQHRLTIRLTRSDGVAALSPLSLQMTLQMWLTGLGYHATYGVALITCQGPIVANCARESGPEGRQLVGERPAGGRH
jgi:hypothetical protein